MYLVYNTTADDDKCEEICVSLSLNSIWGKWPSLYISWMVTSKWIDLWLVCLSYVVIFFYEREIEHCNSVLLSNYLICWLFSGSPRFTLVQEHISRLPRSSVSWRKPPIGKSSKLCWGKGHNSYRLYLYCL